MVREDRARLAVEAAAARDLRDDRARLTAEASALRDAAAERRAEAAALREQLLAERAAGASARSEDLEVSCTQQTNQATEGLREDSCGFLHAIIIPGCTECLFVSFLVHQDQTG